MQPRAMWVGCIRSAIQGVDTKPGPAEPTDCQFQFIVRPQLSRAMMRELVEWAEMFDARERQVVGRESADIK